MELIVVIGALIAILGAIGLLIEAFNKGIWWGLGCLLVNPVSLVFVFLHWKDARNPFLLELSGIALIIVALLLKG